MKDKITKRSSIRFSFIERINYYFSDPLKKHNNSIESVKETEKQSKEAAPLSDFLSSHKGDNSPPKKKDAARPFIFGVSKVRTTAAEADRGWRYCSFGCRFARPPRARDARLRKHPAAVTHEGKARSGSRKRLRSHRAAKKRGG